MPIYSVLYAEINSALCAKNSNNYRLNTWPSRKRVPTSLAHAVWNCCWCFHSRVPVWFRPPSPGPDRVWMVVARSSKLIPHWYRGSHQDPHFWKHYGKANREPKVFNLTVEPVVLEFLGWHVITVWGYFLLVHVIWSRRPIFLEVILRPVCVGIQLKLKNT